MQYYATEHLRPLYTKMSHVDSQIANVAQLVTKMIRSNEAKMQAVASIMSPQSSLSLQSGRPAIQGGEAGPSNANGDAHGDARANGDADDDEKTDVQMHFHVQEPNWILSDSSEWLLLFIDSLCLIILTFLIFLIYILFIFILYYYLFVAPTGQKPAASPGFGRGFVEVRTDVSLTRRSTLRASANEAASKDSTAEIFHPRPRFV